MKKLHRITAALLLVGSLPTLTFAEGSGMSGTAVGAQPPQQPQPSNLKPGLRISYYASAASVAGAPKQYTTDPEGNLIDPNGTRYTANDTPTASGQGITQVTVIAAEDNKVLLETAMYLIDATTNNTLRFTTSSNAVAPADHVDYLYADPKGFANLQNMNQNGVRVTRGKITLDKIQYDAIGIHTDTAAGWTQMMIDAKTGFVLTSTSMTAGAGAAFDPNNPAAGANPGNTQLTYTKFLGTREVKLPWINSKAPAWEEKLGRLDFVGKTTIFGPDMIRIQGTPPMVQSSVMSMTPTKKAAHWVELDIRSKVDNPGLGMPAEGAVAAVFGGGGLWLDPAAFAKFKPGDVLDEDPITKMKVVVAQTKPGVIGYQWTMKLDRAAAYFDAATGLFNGTVREDRQNNKTDEVWRK